MLPLCLLTAMQRSKCRPFPSFTLRALKMEWNLSYFRGLDYELSLAHIEF